ncbi:MAG TPA: hypothetical protein VMW24_16660 [Sedimentisphaerales bacterium]|nr:hypothetical protein [Sedimentisphaerales bacterium]
MKIIDLGEKESTCMPSSSKSTEPRVYYPSVHFSDNGQDGKSSFDSSDINKKLTVTVTIKLVSIGVDDKGQGKKKFQYHFEVQKIEMPDDMSKEGDRLKGRQEERAKKRGMA